MTDCRIAIRQKISHFLTVLGDRRTSRNLDPAAIQAKVFELHDFKQ
jgi:hypothetical protein